MGADTAARGRAHRVDCGRPRANGDIQLRCRGKAWRSDRSGRGSVDVRLLGRLLGVRHRPGREGRVGGELGREPHPASSRASRDHRLPLRGERDRSHQSARMVHRLPVRRFGNHRVDHGSDGDDDQAGIRRGPPSDGCDEGRHGRGALGLLRRRVFEVAVANGRQHDVQVQPSRGHGGGGCVDRQIPVFRAPGGRVQRRRRPAGLQVCGRRLAGRGHDGRPGHGTADESRWRDRRGVPQRNPRGFLRVHGRGSRLVDRLWGTTQRVVLVRPPGTAHQCAVRLRRHRSDLGDDGLRRAGNLARHDVGETSAPMPIP